MSEASSGQVVRGPTNSGDDASRGQLDLFSPFFDAELALLHRESNEIVNLDTDIVPIDSLFKVRYLLPEDDPDRLFKRAIIEEEEVDEDMLCVDREVKKVKTVNFKLPFEAIAASFQEGPMSVLRLSLNKNVAVKVRRSKDSFAWCYGKLVAFDRHMNMLLSNGEEQRYIPQLAIVSARRKHLKDKLEYFFMNFGTQQMKGLSPREEAEMTLVQFGTNEIDMWRHLHDTYGLTQRVQAILANTEKDPARILLKWAGNEHELLARLEAKSQNRPPPRPSQIAEWVKLPSEKYPGYWFYTNTRTGETRWEAPEGVVFRQVVERVLERKPFQNLIIRGDVVAVFSRKS